MFAEIVHVLALKRKGIQWWPTWVLSEDVFRELSPFYRVAFTVRCAERIRCYFTTVTDDKIVSRCFKAVDKAIRAARSVSEGRKIASKKKLLQLAEEAEGGAWIAAAFALSKAAWPRIENRAAAGQPALYAGKASARAVEAATVVRHPSALRFTLHDLCGLAAWSVYEATSWAAGLTAENAGASAQQAVSVAKEAEERIRRELANDIKQLKTTQTNAPAGQEGVPENLWAMHATFNVGDNDQAKETELTGIIGKELIRFLSSKPEALQHLEDYQFEELVAELLKSFGLRVALLVRTRDDGKDIIAIDSSVAEIKYLVECKKWSPDTKVGVNVVRQLHGVVQQSRATKGILVTTSQLTQPAKEFIKPVEWQLEAREFAGLLEWLKRYDESVMRSVIRSHG